MSDSQLLEMIKSLISRSIGCNGGTVLNGSGSTVSGQFFAIQSVGSSAKLATVNGDPNVTGLEIPVGSTIYGNFVSVTSGADATDVFICYKK